MPLTDATIQSVGNHLASLITHLAIHTADPGTTGANLSSATRQAVSWTVDADGDLSIPATITFSGGAANGAATYVGFWSASSGGTFRGSYKLAGDQVFNSVGQFSISTLVVNGVAP